MGKRRQSPLPERDPFIDHQRLQAKISCRNLPKTKWKLSRHNPSASRRRSQSGTGSLSTESSEGDSAKFLDETPDCHEEEGTASSVTRQEGRVPPTSVGLISLSSRECVRQGEESPTMMGDLLTESASDCEIINRSGTPPPAKKYAWQEGTVAEQEVNMQKRRDELLVIEELGSDPQLVAEWVTLLQARESLTSLSTPQTPEAKATSASLSKSAEAFRSMSAATLRVTLKAAKMTAWSSTSKVADMTACSIKREIAAMKAAWSELSTDGEVRDPQAKTSLISMLESVPTWFRSKEQKSTDFTQNGCDNERASSDEHWEDVPLSPPSNSCAMASDDSDAISCTDSVIARTPLPPTVDVDTTASKKKSTKKKKRDTKSKSTKTSLPLAQDQSVPASTQLGKVPRARVRSTRKKKIKKKPKAEAAKAVVLQTILEESDELALPIEKRSSDDDPGPTMQQTLAAQKTQQGPIRTVTLKKQGNRPIGVCLENLRITALSRTAMACGLCIGDTIVRVNNLSVTSDTSASVTMSATVGEDILVSVIGAGIQYNFADV